MFKSQDETQLAYFDRDKLIWNSPLKSNEKLMLHALNSFVGADGRCFPKHSRLMSMTSFARSTVIKVLGNLEKSGIICIDNRWREDGSQSTNDYYISWNMLKALCDKGVRISDTPVHDTDTGVRETDTPCPKYGHQELPIPTTQLTNQLNTNNIDSVSGENAETDESNLETGITNEKSKANGTVSPGQKSQDSGRRETHETQNETIAPPKKKWNPSIPIGFDNNGYIKLPPLKDVDPNYKAKYSAIWPKVYRETQFMVAEQWVEDVTIEEDEDGEVLICDKNGDWTEEEAFGQGGQLPLRKLRDIAAADPYSGFSVDEYNQFIIDRFNFYWSRF